MTTTKRPKKTKPRGKSPKPAPPPDATTPGPPTSDSKPDKPKVRPAPYLYYDDCAQCREYRRIGGPYHTGSTGCRSGSLASGGQQAHCSCDTCF